MTDAVFTRHQSGEACLRPGYYLFDGYLDDSRAPAPDDAELEVLLQPGDAFPHLLSAGKPCWWIYNGAVIDSDAEYPLPAAMTG